MLAPAVALLIVALVKIAKVETGGHVKAGIGNTSDFLVLLLMMTVDGADATAAAASGPRWLRIDILVMPIAAWIRFRAAG